MTARVPHISGDLVYNFAVPRGNAHLRAMPMSRSMRVLRWRWYRYLTRAKHYTPCQAFNRAHRHAAYRNTRTLPDNYKPII